MAARTIDGPEKDWLDMADVTHRTRMSESTIKRLMGQGEFPRPQRVSEGIAYWHWLQIVHWELTKMFAAHNQANPQKAAARPPRPESADDDTVAP
ncbi:MAG TPA: AlpA family phage regulatory protein [Gemmataceae bacterium]|nr:AlpA family phage regulatory protein [Gemmataceae bacterium]